MNPDQQKMMDGLEKLLTDRYNNFDFFAIVVAERNGDKAATRVSYHFQDFPESFTPDLQNKLAVSLLRLMADHLEKPEAIVSRTVNGQETIN